MSTTDQSRTTLAKIESLLAGVVGVQKMVMVTVPELLTHVHLEIEKAKGEDIAKSRPRLSLLLKSVMYASAAIEDVESDAIRVPVFVADQTTLGDQENTLTNFAAAAAKNQAMGSFFEKAEKAASGDGAGLEGLVAKLAKQIATLSTTFKVEEEESEEEKARKAAAGGKDGEKKPPFPPKPPPPPGKGAKPEEEDEEKRKAAEKAIEALPDRGFLLVIDKGEKDGKPEKDRKFPFMKADGTVDIDMLNAAIDAIGKAEELDEDDKEMLREKAKRILEAQKKVGKGLGKGEAVWPDDMNDPATVKKGETDWGLDDLPAAD